MSLTTGTSTHSSTGTSMHSNASTITDVDANRNVVIPMPLPSDEKVQPPRIGGAASTREIPRPEAAGAALSAPDGSGITAEMRIGWQEIFDPCPFFCQYEHYLELRLQAGSEVELVRWEGYVLSRIRKLIQALEYTGAVTYVHPYTNSTVIAAAIAVVALGASLTSHTCIHD